MATSSRFGTTITLADPLKLILNNGNLFVNADGAIPVTVMTKKKLKVFKPVTFILCTSIASLNYIAEGSDGR